MEHQGDLFSIHFLGLNPPSSEGLASARTNKNDHALKMMNCSVVSPILGRVIGIDIGFLAMLCLDGPLPRFFLQEVYGGDMVNLSQQSEASLMAMVANSSIAIVVSNPRLSDNPIIIGNDAFVELTGYSESEIIGRNCRFLTGKNTDPETTKMISDAIRNHRVRPVSPT